MKTSAENALPSIAELITPLLLRVAATERPLLVAYAERLAAARYRSWAERVASPQQRTSLLACAAREEEIATRVEALLPNAGERQRALLEAHPELLEINRSIFADRPLEQQFKIQAQGERAGAGLWRRLAEAAPDGHARNTYEECARLEEASAELLEALLAAMAPPAKQASPAVRGARYLHTNLIARDWRALARFYQQVFGCRMLPPERDLSGRELELGTGVAKAQLRGVHLRLPGHGDDGPTLEIFSYSEHVPGDAPAVNRLGLAHLAFAVASLAEARAQVVAAGGSTLGEIVRTQAGPDAVITWCYVRDPEGNILELQAR